MLRVDSQLDYLTVEPTSAFLSTDHICSYMLTIENYQEGDMIEISGVDAHLTELTIFFGGYSPVTSSKSLKLANKRRYLLDGT